MALMVISPIENYSASELPTNEHIDLKEPGLILNSPIGCATDCSNTFLFSYAFRIKWMH